MVFVSEFGLSRLRSVNHDRSVADPVNNQPQADPVPEVVADAQPVAPSTPPKRQSVPVYGMDGEKQRAVSVQQPVTRQRESAVEHSSGQTVSLVQIESAVRELADGLAAVRGMVMVAVGHDARVADLILDSLLLYGQATRSLDQLRDLAKKTERQLAHIAGGYVTQTMQRAEVAVRELDTYIRGVVTDQVVLRKLIAKLQHTTVETRRVMSAITHGRELAERRAYLRATVRRVLLRLQQFPELSVHERSVREQLQAFSSLDAFANFPESRSEQQELQVVLERLEPIYASLEESITAIMDRPLPTEDPSLDTALEDESEWWPEEVTGNDETVSLSEEDGGVPEFELESESMVTMSPNEGGEPDVAPRSVADPTAPIESESAALVSSAAAKPDPVQPATDSDTGSVEATSLSQGLGTYQLQRGDTLVDLLLGETDAGILPAMVEIPPSYIGTLAELVRAYLDQYRTVRLYLGTREAIDVWAMRGSGHPQISLDHLNDIVMFVAARNDLLSVSDTAWGQLANTFAELEMQADAVTATLAERSMHFTPLSVRQRQQGQGRGVRWANFGRGSERKASTPSTMTARSILPQAAQSAWQQVIDQVYKGDDATYEVDLTTWVDTLFLHPRNRGQLVGSVLGKASADAAPDPRQAFLSLRFGDWYSLLHDTTLRYEWLQRHMVPASTWRDWSRQVLTWQRILQGYPRDTVRDLPLLSVAELVFIDRSLRPTAR